MSEHKLPWGWAPQLGYGVLPDGTRVDHEGMITFLEQSLAHERQQAETWRDWKALVERAEADMTEALNQLNHERQQREAAEAAVLRASALADATEEALAESIGRAEAAEAERDIQIHAVSAMEARAESAEAVLDQVLASNIDLKSLTAKLLALAEAQRRALELVQVHVEELEIAWQRGVINETDAKGGTRSNRNVDVRVLVSAALATDLDALQAEAKELGIDALTPAMAPETGNAPR